jgi:hypothetical protein
MAYSLVAHVGAGSPNTNSFDTSGINTTGANLIVISIGTFGANANPTDSKGNTWTALTQRTNSSRNQQLFYCASPTVGSGHTFNPNSGNASYPTINVTAWSGAAASPFDQQSGAASRQPGSITPSEDNCLLVTGVMDQGGGATTIDSGFTISDTETNDGNHFNSSAAYLVQTTAGAVNPSWSADSSNIVSAMASFKAATVTPLIQWYMAFK